MLTVVTNLLDDVTMLNIDLEHDILTSCHKDFGIGLAQKGHTAYRLHRIQAKRHDSEKHTVMGKFSLTTDAIVSDRALSTDVHF